MMSQTHGEASPPEPAEEEVARAHVYGLLATLTARPPDRELLELLAGIEVPEGAGGEMSEAWRELRAAAAEAEPEGLADEYHALFIGLGRGEISPYASWYRTGYLMEAPLAALREDLARLGLARQAGVGEPEDHIAALCETMSLLIQTRPGAQQAFFAAHLAPWAGRLFADLREAQAARFYRTVGTIGLSFIQVEQAYFSMPV